ncbi:uncharacterized protein ColSpa_11373 [Colletotrichum spaethianum]|uniref:LysM domain-containing protein n=1 Tax=Colletotrichum spaethianum TaxID=700344 RepID=A0AA37PFG3_9PEZI|nr:uncharacterized protein ColSpa_11373 [Colletotrichum spaethianum]GKT51192.1 hypothetical protein ColSpa_11373 [Colletotrichum spaethianum]
MRSYQATSCRAWGETDEEVNYYTCMDLADFYWMDIETFFKLNPILKSDCSSIQPKTEYCPDGYCGDGTCYEGHCPGDAVYTTDGKCGLDHGMRQCAGKWGDCYSMDGEYGTGPDFCGTGKCQMGNCTGPSLPTATSLPPFSIPGVSSSTASRTTTSAATKMGAATTPSSSTVVPPSPACTGGTTADGISGNFIGLCSYRCDFNHCPAGVCVCTGPAAKPAAIPALNDRHGCPDDNVAGGPDHAYYVDLSMAIARLELANTVEKILRDDLTCV